jgi:hypothetical protein
MRGSAASHGVHHAGGQSGDDDWDTVYNGHGSMEPFRLGGGLTMSGGRFAGPRLHGDLELMFYAEGRTSTGSESSTSTWTPVPCSW